MAQNDLLKSGNFRFVTKNQRNVEFFVQEVNLPGFSLGEMTINAHLAQQERRPGDNISWNNLSMQVICDEDLNAFEEARQYVMDLRDPETGELDPLGMIFEGFLFLTTNKNNVQKHYVFHNCWINSVGDMQLSTTTSEDDPVTFQVDVTYTYYELHDISLDKSRIGL